MYEYNGKDLALDTLLPKLAEALSSKKTNGLFSVAFLDQVASLAAKIHHPAATWLGQLEFIYRTTGEVLDELGLTEAAVVKFEGDGLIIVVGGGHAAILINAMIMVMERLTQASQKALGHFTGEMTVQMKCGIATGELLRFTPPHGGIDHLGPAMDIAARLCSVASPKAILVDVNTIETANMGMVKSQIGVWRNRTPAQYRGEEQRVTVKGLENPLPYHEINWDENPFGLASMAVTEVTRPTPPPAPPTPPSSTKSRRSEEKAVGKVKAWFQDKGFGFVAGPDGEDFYLSAKSLVYDEDMAMLAVGTEVAFAIAPPVQEGKARRAVTALVAGADAEGRLTYIHPTRGFGFLEVEDAFGNTISVHLPSASDSRWKVGSEVTFKVGCDPRGPRALDPELATEDGNEGGALTVVGAA